MLDYRMKKWKYNIVAKEIFSLLNGFSCVKFLQNVRMEQVAHKLC
jgi:hypothetical protein